MNRSRKTGMTGKTGKTGMNWMIVVAGVLAAGISGCAGDEDAPPMGDVHGDMPMGEPMQGMQGMEGMEGMRGMQRHAEEADSMASVMREHIRQTRGRPAEQWYDRMDEHVRQVSQMLSLVNRQMREMDMGMGMSDEQMGEMMGMTGEEHRRMMDEMQAVRSELEQLQTASRDEVRERMPDHLDRLERMVDMLEQSAGHMRSM